MGIGPIGKNRELPYENPFMDRLASDNNPKVEGDKSQGIEEGGKAGKTHGTEGASKLKQEEGASSQNQNPNAKLDKSDFTNESDMQEIDLEEFEDDFQ